MTKWSAKQVTRDGRVFMGRNRYERKLAGRVWKVRGGWKCDLVSDVYPRQCDAVLGLMRSINGPA